MKHLSLNTLFPKKRTESHVHAVRDWYLLVTICLLLVVGSALWNVWLFWQIANGKSLEAVHTQPAQTETQTVKDVQNVFQSRANERVNYQSNYTFVDPSK